MPISPKIVQWLLDEEVSVATVLGFLSIPFTVAVSLSTGPSHIDFSPVLLAGFLAGLYYSNRSTSIKRAGFRIGVIGGLPIVWNTASIIASGWAISFGYAALGVAFSSLLALIVLALNCLFSVLSALVGNAIGRVLPFRRSASTV